MYLAASSSDTMFLGEMETNYCIYLAAIAGCSDQLYKSYTSVLQTQSRPQTSSGAYITSSITCAILKVIHAGVGFGSGSETIANTNTARTTLVKVVSQSGYCSFRVH